MKVLITGYPGTGKSTLAKALKARGRNAYDPQAMMSYMHVEHRESGRRIAQPQPVPRGWYDTIGSYNWDSIKLRKLLNQPGDIFICSLAHNQDKFYGEFDLILVLQTNDASLKKRLQKRSDDQIGSAPDEIADILQHKQHFEDSLLDAGAQPLDTSVSVEETIEQILQAVRT